MVMIGHDRVAAKVNGKDFCQFMQAIFDPLTAMFKAIPVAFGI